MAADSELDGVARERLSALVDGELEIGAVSQACAHWRRSAGLRESWHAYQLIGDVLRSDDLASDPAHDAEFLNALRRRLAVEPVPLAQASPDTDTELREMAPMAVPDAVLNVRPARRRAWLASSAVATVFIVIGAGVLSLTRESGRAADSVRGQPMAQVLSADDAASASNAAAGEASQIVLAGGELLRDARLDRYLAAHKQFAGTSALGVPSAYLRSATVNGAER